MKKIIYLAYLSLAVFLFTGCAVKPKATLAKNFNVYNPEYIVEIHNGTGSPSWAASEKEAFLNVLQASAITATRKGFDYFAIIKPDSISNKKGVLINTADELSKKCIPSAFKVLDFGGLHKCGTYATNAVWKIQLFHKRPKDFLVYSAKDVINYLKAKDFYDEDLSQELEITMAH